MKLDVEMSSREIAELTGKRHDHVLRDIDALILTLSPELGLGFKSSSYEDSTGKSNRMFVLDRDSTYCLVAGYDANARMRIIKRWQELEAALKPALPENYQSALRALADQVDLTEREHVARLIAEKTKAEIGGRREATAMNTASQAVKKVEKLEVQLDKAKQYASIKRMGLIYHGQKFDWRLLKSIGNEMGIPSIDIFDSNYGTVKSYHADVWREAYALEIESAEHL